MTNGTPASKTRYAAVIAEWQAQGQQLAPPDNPSPISIADLVSFFWEHVQVHYRRKDGTPTTEQNDFALSLRPLVHLYGAIRSTEFGPLKLRAVRQLMIDGYIHPKYGEQARLARRVVNQRVGRIRRMFKWAVGREYVAASVLQALLAVEGLQAGRTEARDTDPVRPVPRAVVDVTLPFLQPKVADMVRLQLETGMRPGELVIMRACDLDMTGELWEYRPHHHKNTHRGGKRVVTIGPRAQQIIRRYLVPKLDAYIFSPETVRDDMDADRRQKRRSPMTPSQARRRRRTNPKRKPRERYTTDSYGKAVARACARAFPVPVGVTAAEQVKAWRADHRWAPHRLRHTRATEIRKEAGLDIARAVLGHQSPVVTEVYAEQDLEKARQVMRKIG